MIDWNWKDSQDRTIHWEEKDEATVHQLIDFLYTGNYKYMVAPSELNSDKYVELELPLGITNSHIDKTPKEADAQSDNGFTARSAHDATEGDVPIDKQVATRIEFILRQDAKVYAVAHYLVLTDLKDLALARIQDVLDSTSELGPELLRNIVELIKYVYTHTDTLVSSKEPLRELVATFAAKWFHAFHRDEVKELVSKGGDSLVDIIEKVQQHAKDLKAEHEDVEKDMHKQMVRYQKRLRKRGGKVDGTDSGGVGHTG